MVSIRCMLFSSMLNGFLRLIRNSWFIALIALLLRAAFLLYKAHLIPAIVLASVPFQNEAGNVASALAQGQGFCCLFRQPTGPTAWLAPAYPLLIAGIFKIFGIFTLRSFYASVLLNCLSSALACVPVFAVGKRLGGQNTAAVAAWLWAIFPSGIILPFEWIWDTSLSAFLAAVLLWATLELADSLRWRDFVLYGLLWGLSLLTNPALGALFPFLFGWILYRHRYDAKALVTPSLICLVVLVFTCLPWTLRNCIQFHRFIPLRSNFAFEFWSGNNEIFDENSHEVNRITRFEQIRLYARLGENAFLDDRWHRATAFVRKHPALYVQLFGRRIVSTWIGSESPLRDFLQTDSALARFLLLWNALALVGVMVGLARLYLLHRGFFLPIAAWPLVFPITFYVAHTSLRHRHPCDPVLALLIAIAITGASGRIAPVKVNS
jgi:4-amino-4-deoxy-L-arabinose transferase-like glycosyltransferase